MSQSNDTDLKKGGSLRHVAKKLKRNHKKKKSSWTIHVTAFFFIFIFFSLSLFEAVYTFTK
jgi:hypothetical protein